MTLRICNLILLTVCSVLLLSLNGLAHPMPNSVLKLNVADQAITGTLQLPLSQLSLALNKDVYDLTNNSLPQSERELSAYLLQHIHLKNVRNQDWTVAVQSMHIDTSEQAGTNVYKELTVQLLFTPPASAELRNFTLYYDVIIHQVVTHAALITVSQDWDRGLTGDKETEVGVIGMDVVHNTVPPMDIDLGEGSTWQGFWGMLNLGMEHIAVGTDHLLFLLTLLLPAPLLLRGKRWGNFGGARYSIKRLVSIVTAFTIGHSITLLLGALGWMRFPSQPIEILIAISIFVSAIHAIRPVFPGKEMFVAAGFGLVHGSAFAGTLYGLHLSSGKMALSILGFNLGIEVMQLFIIVLTIPWLIILSMGRIYGVVRIAIAVLAMIAAMAWIVERISRTSNRVAEWLLLLPSCGTSIIILLAVLALVSLFLRKSKLYKLRSGS